MKIGKNKSTVAAGADLEPVWRATSVIPEPRQGCQELHAVSRKVKARGVGLPFSFCCRLDTVPHRYLKEQAVWSAPAGDKIKLVRNTGATFEDWEEHRLVLCPVAGQLLCASGADPALPNQ